MENKPICPYCGSPMYKRIIPFVDGAWGGKYDCGNSKCGISSPYVESYNQNECRKLAYESALKRPLQKPILLDDILDSPFQIPCWIEWKKNGMVRLVADVLDRSDYDRFFGQVDANMLEQGLVDHMTRYRADNYGKTWRCWAARPTDEERKAAVWEV